MSFSAALHCNCLGYDQALLLQPTSIQRASPMCILHLSFVFRISWWEGSPTLLRWWRKPFVYRCTFSVCPNSQSPSHMSASACLLYQVLKDWHLCQHHAQVEGTFDGTSSCTLPEIPELSPWAVVFVTLAPDGEQLPYPEAPTAKAWGAIIVVCNVPSVVIRPLNCN